MYEIKTRGGLEQFWDPPAHLSPRSAALWTELVPDDSRSPERLTLLQLALENLDVVDRCNESLAVEGLTIRTLGSNNLRAHPALKIRADAMSCFLQCWRLLGLQCTESIDRVPLSKLWHPNKPAESDEE